MENNPEEISLQEIGQMLWFRRFLITGLTVLFGVGAFALALVLPEKFEASVVFLPVGDDAGGKLGGAGALLSQFGGLASLGGINLGGSNKKSEAVATLGSAALTEAFIKDNDLLPVLFKEKWDTTTGKWKSSDPEKIPTLWKAERKFRKTIRAVSEDKKTGLITLTITWKDPAQCAAWANDIVNRTNLYLRTKAIEQSMKNLDYLNEQLGTTNIVELQKAIYSLTEAEIKKIMVANGSDEYAFKIIDPARVAEERSDPKRGLIIVVGIFSGGMLGVLIALVLPKRKSTFNILE